ncbi:MAG TPA: Gfo/Idh/MocA family oxidoreductase [Steroidobacteraceae bacterium]|nr:Gfo/Idh/MocA family oxidoreductase [Steroidobacteraceae bacterium]
MPVPRLGFGLIGSGYMGRAHAIALHSAAAAFGADYAVECVTLADTTAERARQAAQALGFAGATDDWRTLIADPAIDVVDICTPNYLHAEMALAAIAAGKHVYCEKPLALDLQQSQAIVTAARRAKVCNVIGFNYICNPMLQVAREMIAAGELGEIVSFRGSYLEDYMSDPGVPYSWRCQRKLAGAGALADLGSHLINMAHFLLGSIARVSASLQTVHTHRADRASGQRLPVENEDMAQALVEFSSGVSGTMEISRIATGYKCGLAVEVHGTRGTLLFDQERVNELKLYSTADAAGRRGFRTILAGPEHADYAAFCPAPGHGLGINDLKVIEVRNLIRALRSGTDAHPDFAEGLRVQQVMSAMERAAQERGWVEIDKVVAA